MLVLLEPDFRTCPHRNYVRIFEHNFGEGKAKMCRWAVARQAFSTQQSAKFAEKTCEISYVDRFLYCSLIFSWVRLEISIILKVRMHA